MKIYLAQLQSSKENVHTNTQNIRLTKRGIQIKITTIV